MDFLNDLRPGESAVVRELLTVGRMRRRLLDIGLAKGAPVTCVGTSPGGDPSAYLICGAVVAIRSEDARGVRIKPMAGGDGPWA